MTVFSAGISPVFPSLVLTVTLPLESTVMSSLLKFKPVFDAITASLTASLSSCVRFLGSLTSVKAGSSSLRRVSFCTTVWSGVNEPTLPPWSIFTDPSSFTVMSSSLKFLSGLAALIASLTACFSV